MKIQFQSNVFYIKEAVLKPSEYCVGLKGESYGDLQPIRFY
ncbi:hypothetical protein K08M3_48360 [Vibrio alginolyticus]|uniref:Uncharacterized protein n=1 Tax=Vibrio alginolyticus TaxID=663 RepID=A0A1W6VZF2_VIBAL|nr:hypothetical protein K04M1_48230 [Vibrio alginolyticus]ARP11451.1 hypothetical protein K04M3_48820 [Vibrio alginolyticus]ARP16509.1 hypothetical protein K04M5_48570 [Vibrio alginolyticus]ARP21551.1 hypothetical protein K05K4_48420 [Vibrio alginolyticus]ARP26632.1 hypothetical protein K06K5_48320 [Vibrio alginolyticus]